MGFLRSWGRFLAVGLVILIILVILYSIFGRTTDDDREVALSEAISDAQHGDVEEIEVRGDTLTIHLQDGTEYRTRKEEDTNIIDLLADSGVTVGGDDGVRIEVHARDGGVVYDAFSLVFVFLPIMIFGTLVLAIAYWIFRRARAIGS